MSRLHGSSAPHLIPKRGIGNPKCFGGAIQTSASILPAPQLSILAPGCSVDWMPYLADCWKGTGQEQNSNAYKSIRPDKSCSKCTYMFLFCVCVCFFKHSSLSCPFSALIVKKCARHLLYAIHSYITCTENEYAGLEFRALNLAERENNKKVCWPDKIVLKSGDALPPNGGMRVSDAITFFFLVCFFFLYTLHPLWLIHWNYTHFSSTTWYSRLLTMKPLPCQVSFLSN